MRIGHGYDVHKLVEGRKLIMGGVEIPYEKGLLGHSDADVLLHAISDSLLGAAALGDIGKLFPDTDPKFKGADSLLLMAEVYRRLKEMGYSYFCPVSPVMRTYFTEEGVLMSERFNLDRYNMRAKKDFINETFFDVDSVYYK